MVKRLKKEAFHQSGGDGRDRTDDLHNAIVALYQLSYVPTQKEMNQTNLPRSVNLEKLFFAPKRFSTILSLFFSF